MARIIGSPIRDIIVHVFAEDVETSRQVIEAIKKTLKTEYPDALTNIQWFCPTERDVA